MALFYDHANICVHHADCLEVLPTLDAESFDFVLTDPPYLVDYKGRWDGDKLGIVGDDDPSWLRPAFREIHRVLKNDSLAVTFYGWPQADIFVGTFKALGFRIISHLAFIKNV